MLGLRIFGALRPRGFGGLGPRYIEDESYKNKFRQELFL